MPTRVTLNNRINNGANCCNTDPSFKIILSLALHLCTVHLVTMRSWSDEFSLSDCCIQGTWHHTLTDLEHTSYIADIPQGTLMGHKTLPKQTKFWWLSLCDDCDLEGNPCMSLSANLNWVYLYIITELRPGSSVPGLSQCRIRAQEL